MGINLVCCWPICRRREIVDEPETIELDNVGNEERRNVNDGETPESGASNPTLPPTTTLSNRGKGIARKILYSFTNDDPYKFVAPANTIRVDQQKVVSLARYADPGVSLCPDINPRAILQDGAPVEIHMAITLGFAKVFGQADLVFRQKITDRLQKVKDDIADEANKNDALEAEKTELEDALRALDQLGSGGSWRAYLDRTRFAGEFGPVIDGSHGNDAQLPLLERVNNYFGTVSRLPEEQLANALNRFNLTEEDFECPNGTTERLEGILAELTGASPLVTSALVASKAAKLQTMLAGQWQVHHLQGILHEAGVGDEPKSRAPAYTAGQGVKWLQATFLPQVKSMAKELVKDMNAVVAGLGKLSNGKPNGELTTQDIQRFAEAYKNKLHYLLPDKYAQLHQQQEWFTANDDHAGFKFEPVQAVKAMGQCLQPFVTDDCWQTLLKRNKSNPAITQAETRIEDYVNNIANLTANDWADAKEAVNDIFLPDASKEKLKRAVESWALQEETLTRADMENRVGDFPRMLQVMRSAWALKDSGATTAGT